MKALVVGCGFLGEALTDRLHAAGCEVVGWTGSSESAARLAATKPYPVEAHDIGDAEALPRAAGRVAPEVLAVCVASGRGGGADAYRRVYLEGARHLLSAFPAVRRVVWTGSTSVLARTDGAWVDETTPAEPDRETGRILRETESLVLGGHGGGGDESVKIVARLAGLYGPGRSVLLKKFLSGEAVIEGEGARWLNQIHRDDAARALELLLLRPDAPPGLYHVTDDTPLTQLALLSGLSERLGRPLPPAGPMDLNRKRGWTSKRVSNARLRALGWRPRFPSFFDALDTLLPTVLV